ncbi:PLDc N-terminal domain-containing protein [Winkia sp. UMB3158]|uniref:Cardiolipin synthase N-terminal domain-containing protein n=2 Tax=Winkia neuii TaxID=33007 RepID=K0YPY9_9ACTO|nr:MULTISPECIES: PLDc N-terminal domain-containing protein [Winkia]OFT37648.1 hypothetical protein HMPREF3163_07735 [Actinomyces sp. HMSC08A01]EJZ85892.1 hypothetical protein HMPREF9240_01365 [Winkia neuii BV029A5]MCG7302463.1 PLDc N-terminal domain-containing protein [Winkia sp. ACRQY]MDK7149294.1 PLDc N-terminal domain-containing protein [Winkia sp. UMB3158]MDK7163792.1 PLDc N-terminal domain-containing protein [Winkia sp. UMB3105]
MARVVMAILTLAVTIYAAADCARTPSDKLPARLPKAIWLLLIILLPPLGALAWIVISRVLAAEANDGKIDATMWSSAEPLNFRHNAPGTRPRTMAPDDDPEFLFKLKRDLQKRRDQEEEGDA